MRKIRDYYICDKCKKEIDKDKLTNVFYQNWHYQLCDDCLEKYKEFDNEINKIKEKWEKLEKEYQFGKYLPEDPED